jgi:hypothetical protein
LADEFHIKKDGSWSFHGEDSRLKDKSKTVNRYIFNPFTGKMEYMQLLPTYCKGCGKFYGYSARESSYVVAFCDDCWKWASQHPRYVPMLPHEEWAWINGQPDPWEESCKKGDK